MPKARVIIRQTHCYSNTQE